MSKVAIIGAGFTGLGAALDLAKKGHQVTIFESQAISGGLAGGFKVDAWPWVLEQHYHHLFGTDTTAIRLSQEVGCPITSNAVNSSTFYHHQFYRFDSPFTLLIFPLLGVVDKLRTGAVLAFFKIWPFWQIFENITSQKLLTVLMGKKSFDILWRPLFEKKFHTFWPQISAVWFWARIKFRTSVLFYPEGGFQNLANKTVDLLKKQGVHVKFNTPVKSVTRLPSGFRITTSKLSQNFDSLISTLPVSDTQKVIPFFQPQEQLIKSLGAINLILELKKPLLPQHIYWLNINDYDLPFLAVVEHTNFISSHKYGGFPLVYIGNYLPPDHEYFHLTPRQLLARYLPGLKKINPDFNLQWVRDCWSFPATYAQSIVSPGFSSQLPSMTTNCPGLFIANIQQVYPHDRGVNYALKLGSKVAKYVK
jgi:protoporphyrinogen oxidase